MGKVFFFFFFFFFFLRVLGVQVVSHLDRCYSLPGRSSPPNNNGESNGKENGK